MMSSFLTKSLITCNFCKGAVETRIDVAKVLDQAISGHSAPSQLKNGYAGCALGTSELLLKDIAVVKIRIPLIFYIGGEVKGLKAKCSGERSDSHRNGFNHLLSKAWEKERNLFKIYSA